MIVAVVVVEVVMMVMVVVVVVLMVVVVRMEMILDVLKCQQSVLQMGPKTVVCVLKSSAVAGCRGSAGQWSVPG